MASWQKIYRSHIPDAVLENHKEIKEKYRQRISDETIVPFIVYLEDNPIGFIN